jgi:hypothetical protein
MIDLCFITDIILTFFSAIERPDGMLEVRKKRIAIEYLKLWFWIDLVSSVPMQLLELFP